MTVAAYLIIEPVDGDSMGLNKELPAIHLRILKFFADLCELVILKGNGHAGFGCVQCWQFLQMQQSLTSKDLGYE